MGAFKPDELPGWAAELLASARVGHLGLLDDRDRPRVLPVTFAVCGGRLYSAVDEEKPKRVHGEDVARVRYLRSRPGAALTVDRYDDDWSRLAWVQALGSVDVLAPAEDEAGLRALCEKYAQYRERPPAGPLLRLTPERVLCWRAS